MAEEVQTKKTISDHLFGWQVVGAVSILLLGIGGGIMTAPHPYIADTFFFVGFSLLLIKFWTWEEAKHDTHRKTAALLAGVTVVALLLFVGACSLSWYINIPKHTAPEVAVVVTPNIPPLAIHSEAAPPQATTAKQSPRTKESQLTPPSRQKAKPIPAPVVATPPPPTNTQTCIGSACAQGQGAQATFNQFGPAKLNISDIQRDNIRDAMVPFTGTEINIMSSTGEPDSQQFGQQLVAALEQAKLSVHHSEALTMIVGGARSSGITISFTEDHRQAAMALGYAIFATGTRPAMIVYNTPEFAKQSFLSVVVQPNK